MSTIAHSDMTITRLQEELALRRQFILQKRKELREAADENEYLLPVLNKYESYIELARRTRQRKIEKLQELLDSLDDLPSAMDTRLDREQIQREIQTLTEAL
jgi:hypothetical protein